MDRQLPALFEKFTSGQDVAPVLAGPDATLAWLESVVGFRPDGFSDPRLTSLADVVTYPLPEGQLQIDATRALAARAAQTPFGGWQAFVIEGLDRATPQAGNNLLKLFEERPPRTFFLATARNPLKVLPTLLSRMTRVADDAPAAGLDPALAAKVDDFLAGATLDLPAFLLDKKAEITRELAADLLSYAVSRAGKYPRAAAALPRMESALRKVATSNASVRAQLDQAFLTLL